MSERFLPRRPRSAVPPEAKLDDLLEAEEPAPPALPDVSPRSWLWPTALQSFILSALVYVGFHLVSLDPSYPMILALCLGSVLVRRAARAASEPSWRRTSDVVRPAGGWRRRMWGGYDGTQRIGGWYEGGDGMLEAIRRWDRRLDWGTDTPERFRLTVSRRVGDLADEVLRLRHGITRSSDPARARALVGEEVWVLVEGQGGRIPTPREVAAAIGRLEAL